ncbi:TPA: hypothetical protein ACXK44_004791 [Pseudomonas aeruginosa]|uniref:hypothetical protein n=1 Tax=Pseudomonas aeruginosa TaxID=287 RepID=UPI00070FEC5A|nr:hypothetical protein [Pseudomonas aeruginosa]EKF7421294.1 hypothetical protein [Pseudomonas aeruginosa]MBS2779590.1 hypothetical protein [Pseudomonas aeruginosa]MBS2806494.1 hypothetical protein [Pseudomonas aeruginosa]MBW6374331.1 hypothetical protein [Pseudomonas aeruginosa]MBW6380369.1 hypothetical protein [Pseudomonas aeruginosa]
MTDSDREQQREILALLNTVYPAKMFRHDLVKGLPAIEEESLLGLVKHLEELGYVEAAFHVSHDGRQRMRFLHATITARGSDYLKDDGGLTAERDTVTIRLHADTIRDLIIAQIAMSDAESSVKSQLMAQVKSLPAKGLEAVVSSLAREGLARLPNAIQWLQTTISAAL